jgi:uncharacterized protein YdcH (DUF465 family)
MSYLLSKTILSNILKNQKPGLQSSCSGRNLVVFRLRSTKNRVFPPHRSVQRELAPSEQKIKDLDENESREKVLLEKIDEMNDFLANIDTTLTPSQREHVEKLKKSIKGGPKSPRCIIIIIMLTRAF